MLEWLQQHQTELQRLGALSIVFLVGAALLVPLAAIYIPEDYFVRVKREPTRKQREHPLMLGLGVLIKNVIGVVLVVAGIVMLVLPGQGLLTILIGLALTNFPGKYALERRIVKQPAIIKTLNWLREKANKPPLQVPD